MMDELKKSLEVVLTTLKGLEGKDQLVIFLFVRSVLEYVESCMVTGDDYSISDVFTDCCAVFQEADDVVVEKTSESIKVQAIKDGKVEKSYTLSKQNQAMQTESVADSEKTKSTEGGGIVEGEEGEDGMYYLSIPNNTEVSGEGREVQEAPQEGEQQVEMEGGGGFQGGDMVEAGESQQQQQPQTVLECSDPSVLQAFLEEGGKLPSYMPPGTQIIIETKDGRTEVIQNTAVVQSEVLDPVAVKQEGGGGGDPDIPVFVMTEDGNMLVSTESKGPMEGMETVATAAAAAAEATPTEQTPRGRGRPRKRPIGGTTMGSKKMKLEDGSDAAKMSDGLTFQCDQCFQYFAHEHSLHRHYRAVHMNMKWTCDDCGREFTRPDSLVNHKKKQSCFKGPGKPTVRFDPNEKFVEGQGYLCEMCDIFFRNLGALKHHRERQHSGIEHACDGCGKKFTSSSYLAAHKDQACLVKGSGSPNIGRKIKTEEDGGEEEEEEEGVMVVGDNGESVDRESDGTLNVVAKLGGEDAEETKPVSSGKKPKREPGEILPKDPNDVFLCEDCGKCLSSKQALIIHMRKHTGEVPFKCQFCGHGANTRGNLLRHLESIHGVTKDDTNIKLDLTNYAADDSSVDSGDNSVLISNVNLSQSDSFTQHGEEEEEEEDMVTTGTGDTLESSQGRTRSPKDTPPTLESLVQELQGNDKEGEIREGGMTDTVLYSVDTKTVQGATMLSVKFKNNPGSGESSSCPPIRHVPERKGVLEEAGGEVVLMPKNPIKKRGRPRIPECDMSVPACPICDKMFHNHSNLAVHMRIHTKEMPYSCDYCDHQFATKANKQRHEQTVHHGRKDWVCEVCDKRFTEKKTMLKHRQTCQSGERPYQCTICDKSFSYKGALQTHVVTHSGEKPYHCEFCELGFSVKTQLKSHMKISHPDEDLGCPVCEKTFVKYDDMEKHMKTHEDLEKKCQLCNAKFNLKQELTDHIKAVHTKEKPFKCDICEGVSFYSKNALSRHMENEHADSEHDDSSQQINGDSGTEDAESSQLEEGESSPPEEALEMSVEGEEEDESEATDSKEAINRLIIANVGQGTEISGNSGVEIKMEPVDVATPGKVKRKPGRPKMNS